MAKVKNPILFSDHFGVSQNAVMGAGFIDTFVNVDIERFIDPLLLSESTNSEVAKKALPMFRKHFSDFLTLLGHSQTKDDAAWKAAARQLNLSEPAENGLGYAGSRRKGASRSEDIKLQIMNTCLQVLKIGNSNPEVLSLMGFLEEGVGSDTISDFTTQAILPILCDITQDFCVSHGVQVETAAIRGKNYKLPHIGSSKDKQPIVLVPLDITRHLPLAKDMSEIEDVIDANASLRVKINSLLGDITKANRTEKKDALRDIILKSSDEIEEFIKGLKERASHYDPNEDFFGYLALISLLGGGNVFGFSGLKPSISTPDEAYKLVLQMLSEYKEQVESNNMWELLWHDGKPARERKSQLLFFGLSLIFCQVFDLDVSPEGNMGGGPVDFKFSRGHATKVVVEFKLSKGSVKQGYLRQLQRYKDASRTNYGIFVVVDVGDLKRKLLEIEDIQKEQIKLGEPYSEIVYIDARPQASASLLKI